MAKGDVNDVCERLRALIPSGWFNESSPVLSSVLAACAHSLAWCYSLYCYARKQTRIATASGGWLDLAAYDFFGNGLQRPPEMADSAFRHLIKTTLLRERGTRQAIIDIVVALTGNTPDVFEPLRPEDTGGYGSPALGYGCAGAYGSRYLPYQAFVRVTKPKGEGIPWIAGYHTPTAGYSYPSRGQYVSRQMIVGSITDGQIYEAISAVKMEGTQVWVQLH